MRRLLSVIGIGVFFGLAVASTASAQQSVNLSIGGFIPQGDQLSSLNLTGRSADDVLARNADFLDFDFHNFRGVTVGGEWLVGLGDKFDVGLGLAFYNKTTPAAYTDFTNANGSDIVQDLSLRIVPFTATVRFLPLGHHDAFVPYIGAGVGAYDWRYRESGQFLATDNSIFSGTFAGQRERGGPVSSRRAAGAGGAWSRASKSATSRRMGSLPADQGFCGRRGSISAGELSLHVERQVLTASSRDGLWSWSRL